MVSVSRRAKAKRCVSPRKPIAQVTALTRATDLTKPWPGVGATDTSDGMYYSAMNDVYNNLLAKLNTKKQEGTDRV